MPASSDVVMKTTVNTVAFAALLAPTFFFSPRLGMALEKRAFRQAKLLSAVICGTVTAGGMCVTQKALGLPLDDSGNVKGLRVIY